jgi:hypothetical protein
LPQSEAEADAERLAWERILAEEREKQKKKASAAAPSGKK